MKYPMKNRLVVLVAAFACALDGCSGSEKSDGSSSDADGAGSPATAGGASAISDGGEPNRGTGPAGGGGTNGGADDGGSGGPGGAGDGGAFSAAAGGVGGEASSSDTCVFPAASALPGASVPPGYCAYLWASGLTRPRGMVVDENGDVLVDDYDRILLLHDDDGNGVSDVSERIVLRTQIGVYHGIAIDNGYLYASSVTTVYRWPYTANRQPLGEPQEVVTGIPSGGHVTRTLQFDTQGRLYVSIGSADNLDSDSRRARVLRYAANVLGSTSTFANGELFADGLRNEVGLGIDSRGRIWGVENGRDHLERADLGNDIHEDNPGEELNLFLEKNAGRFYGYPYCWSEFNLPNTGQGPGTQWADPDITAHNDAWCKDTANVIPPVLVMQGHSAPLDVKFYSGKAFPPDLVGDALITFHGSWNRTTATGYKVVRVPFGADGMPSGAPVPLLESANPGDTDSEWPHRPVSLGIGKSGQVFVSSDTSGVIIAVGHGPR
jgi:glucose/arabinose dehydrogenase